jgi:phosphoenolpyruvate synthase/pyruvate phosphate dikinase
MKRLSVFCGLLAFSLVFGLAMLSQAVAQGKMESFSGEVTAVDPGCKAIVIESGKGKAALVVGAIITPDTVLMVKGKKMAIADLAKEVKAGDKVTLRIERTTDLYAKEIAKK